MNNHGAAMMVTIIIIAVLVVFTFSLILISYNLYASQNKNLSSDRNSEAANSLARALEEELTDENALQNSNLWKYLRCNIAYSLEGITDDDAKDWKDWPYYDPSASDGDAHDEKHAKRYFKLDRNSDIKGMPADVSICLYWELPDKELSGGEVVKVGPDVVENNKNGIILHIEISCVTAGQSYKISDAYMLTELGTEGDSALEMKIDNVRKNSRSNPMGHDIDKTKVWRWDRKTDR